MKTIAYAFAHRFILSNIDDSFDLTSEQEDRLRPQIIDLLAQIERHVFPMIRDDLFEARDRVRRESPSAEDFAWVKARSRAHWIALVDALADEAGEFLQSLSDEQITFYEKKIEKTHAKHLEIFEKSTEKILAHFHDRYVDRLEDTCGNLTRKQEAAVKDVLPQNPSFWRSEIEMRHAVKRQFVGVFRKHPSAAELAKTLRQWAVDPRTSRSAEANQVLDELRAEQWGEMLPRIAGFLEAAQRQQCATTLDDYAKEIDTIIESRRKEDASAAASAN